IQTSGLSTFPTKIPLWSSQRTKCKRATISTAARKRGKATPRIHSKRKTKRRRGSSQMLMFCFFDINLRTHMGVFI
ncbi:mCG145146, partial [Mus musculus]